MCPPKRFQAAPPFPPRAARWDVLCLYVYLFPASQHFAKHTRAQTLGVVMWSAGRRPRAEGPQAEGPPSREGRPVRAAPGARGRPRFPRRPRRFRGASAPPPGHRHRATRGSRDPRAAPRPALHRQPPKKQNQHKTNQNTTIQDNTHSFCFFRSCLVKSVSPSGVYAHITVLTEQRAARKLGPSPVPCPVDKRRDGFTQRGSQNKSRGIGMVWMLHLLTFRERDIHTLAQKWLKIHCAIFK